MTIKRSPLSGVILMAILIVTPLFFVHLLASTARTGSVAAEIAGPPLRLYFPLIRTPIGPPLAPPVSIVTIQPLDLEELKADIESRSKLLALNKIGFHIGEGGGNKTGIGDWWTSLNDSQIPVILKSVGNGGDLAAVQSLSGSSSVSHILVYRTAGYAEDGYWFDVPNYELEPAEAAAIHWQRHKDALPPEIDYERAWIETINELDKAYIDWIGQFAVETAKLVLAENEPAYRWAAFGWSTGEPEPEHWESPAMLQFLRMAGANPDRLAIALHEYSLSVDDIADGYPYKVGRFQKLFEICDKYGIPRPTVLITEWGWDYNNVPEPNKAMADIAWASWLYAAYPQVKGAAIWYLGPNFDGIADKAQKLISPVTDYSLASYFEVTPGVGEIDPSLFVPSWQRDSDKEQP